MAVKSKQIIAVWVLVVVAVITAVGAGWWATERHQVPEGALTVEQVVDGGVPQDPSVGAELDPAERIALSRWRKHWGSRRSQCRADCCRWLRIDTAPVRCLRLIWRRPSRQVPSRKVMRKVSSLPSMPVLSPRWKVRST